MNFILIYYIYFFLVFLLIKIDFRFRFCLHASRILKCIIIIVGLKISMFKLLIEFFAHSQLCTQQLISILFPYHSLLEQLVFLFWWKIAWIIYVWKITNFIVRSWMNEFSLRILFLVTLEGNSRLFDSKYMIIMHKWILRLLGTRKFHSNIYQPHGCCADKMKITSR